MFRRIASSRSRCITESSMFSVVLIWETISGFLEMRLCMVPNQDTTLGSLWQTCSDPIIR